MSENLHNDDVWPTEVKLKQQEKELVVTYEDGSTFTFPAEYLRVESPSAEVQGHGPDQKQLVAGRRHVGIMSVEPVGNYAIKINFDDTHDTGIYSWSLLYKLGLSYGERWQAYLDALEAKGITRDP
jgi:DUF971 family protein